MKRFYTLLVLCLSVFSTLMAHDAVVNGIYYNLDTTNKTAEVTYRGENYKSYDGEYSGLVNIPASITYNGVSYKVLSIGEDAFSGCVNMTSIKIAEGIQEIGDGAFYGCGSLTSIEFPNSVTTIGNYVFTNLLSLSGNNYPKVILRHITFGSGLTKVGTDAFGNAISSSIDEGAEVHYKGTADSWAKINFANEYANPLRGTTDLYINGELLTEANITSATSISAYAFINCTSLTSVKMGSSVQKIGIEAFKGCNNLKKVTCYATTVPTVREDSFTNYNAYLYVPCASKVDYDLHNIFGSFKYVECVTDEEGDNNGGNSGTTPTPTPTPDTTVAPLYIKLALNNWVANDTYKLTSADGNYYVANYSAGNEITISGNFKISNEDWSVNYGGGFTVEAGKSYTLIAGGANLDTAGKIKVSKVEFTQSTGVLKITGTTSSNVFDTTTDQGVAFVVNPRGASPVYVPLTYSYNAEYNTAQYTGTYTVTELGITAKIGGLTNFNVIDYGTNGQPVMPKFFYDMVKGAYNGFTIEGDYKVGDVLNILVLFDKDWNSSILINVQEAGTTPTPTPTPNPDPKPEPEEFAFFVAGNGGSDATGIWCNGIEWSSVGVETANNMTDADKDGIYEITFNQVPAGTWNFKVVGVTEGNMSWMGSDFLDTTNSSTGYTTAPYDGNIGFTLTQAADVTVKFNTATGKIILTTPSGSFGKVKIDYFSVANTDECLVENRFTAANNNTLKYTENIQILEGNEYGYAGYRIVGNCNYAVYENSLIIEVTEAGIYDITIVFNGDYDNPDFSVQAEKVETPVVPPVNPDPVYSEIWLYGQVTGYQRLDEWKFTSNDGDNYVIDFATPTELTSLFYLFGKGGEPIVENPGGEPIYIFAADAITNIEANKTYTLVGNGSNAIGVQGIIEATRIEFQLSTATFKVIGTSKAKVFDVTKDYNLCINFNPAYPMTFKGNGVYTGTYVVSADATGYKTSFNFGDVNDAVVAMGSTDPLLYNVAIPLSTTYKNLVTQHVCYEGDTFEFTLTFKSDWTASVVVSYIPNLEGRTYTVNGNGGSDATGIWCGGIEWGYGDSPVNNMTDADADGIYEVTYKNVPAGTWNFKVVALVNAVHDWMGSDYLDTKNSSAGCTTAPNDGNIGFTLNAPADVTIKYNILTGKIIVTTPSGSFAKVKIDHFHITPGSEDVCLDQYEFTEANNYTLTFTKNIVIDPEYGYHYVYYRIIGNCSYAVYEKSFDVKVTENGTYTVTVQFNGDYDNPDFTVTAVKQGGTIDPTPDPDPVVAIKNLMIQPFEQILPNTTTTTVATFTLQNANTATVSIEGLDADFFEIGEQNIGNGECSVSIVFKPIVRGVYYATLVVTTDDEVSLSIDFAAAAGDETFEPGDVPELNPDPVNPGTPDDEVSVEEVSAVMIYAKEGTIYSEVEFEIYDLAGVNVTKLNGSLQGVYIVKTAEGNRLVSVW